MVKFPLFFVQGSIKNNELLLQEFKKCASILETWLANATEAVAKSDAEKVCRRFCQSPLYSTSSHLIFPVFSDQKIFIIYYCTSDLFLSLPPYNLKISQLSRFISTAETSSTLHDCHLMKYLIDFSFLNNRKSLISFALIFSCVQLAKLHAVVPDMKSKLDSMRDAAGEASSMCSPVLDEVQASLASIDRNWEAMLPRVEVNFAQTLTFPFNPSPPPFFYYIVGEGICILLFRCLFTLFIGINMESSSFKFK